MKHKTKINPEDIKLAQQKGYKLVDIREKASLEEIPTIEGAINIPYSSLMENPKQYLDDTKQPILLMCSTGRRSKKLKKQMQDLGYSDVKDVCDGIQGVLKANGDNATKVKKD